MAASDPMPGQDGQTGRPSRESEVGTGAIVIISSPSRAMFESNFSVDKDSYGYGVFWNACKLLAQGASASEKADRFHGTASRVHRLGI